MKALIMLLLLLSFCFYATAQSQDGDATLLAEGDRYFSEEQYNLAVQYYRTLSDKSGQDPRLSYKLAEGYRKTFSYSEAEAYYLKAWYQSGEQNPSALYYYALMLKLNGNFDESIRRFSQFILMAQNQKDLADLAEQAVVDQAGSEMAKAEQGHDGGAYPLTNTSVNTAYNDYAPALRDSNTLVITSSRIESNRPPIDERYGE